ncbi:MAG: Eco57I restriction-modification methylase domain-containing protein, partial [Planctomycetaceae bacterium]|nr:Eco57I restriction-modification methylase domain-containing protein [Planctomycetaceae bacterium]
NFDIVIGNPPYGAKYPKEHKAYFLKHYESAKTADINENGTVVGKLKGSLDTFSLFIEWAFRNVKKNGYVHFIVPLAVVSSDSMTALHQLLFDNCETIKVSSYAKRPVMMFPHSEIRVSIISFVKTNTKCEHLWTTKLNRRSKEVSREKLLQGLQFTDGLRFRLNGRIPKISNPIENKILRKLFVKKHPGVKALLRDEGKPVYYRTSGGLYFNVITNYPSGSTKEKPVYFDKKMANVIGAVLSSSLFWWYQQVYTNNLDLKSFEIESFPIPAAKLTPAVIRKIGYLYEKYLKDIERHVVEHETQEYKHVTQYKEYKIRYSKPLIDAIDGVICPLYGLTDEETEFIKNYEIEFRIDGGENKRD